MIDPSTPDQTHTSLETRPSLQTHTMLEELAPISWTENRRR